LTTLTLYPVAAISPAGDVTFATAPTATGEGAEGLFLASVPRARRPLKRAHLLRRRPRPPAQRTKSTPAVS